MAWSRSGLKFFESNMIKKRSLQFLFENRYNIHPYLFIVHFNIQFFLGNIKDFGDSLVMLWHFPRQHFAAKDFRIDLLVVIISYLTLTMIHPIHLRACPTPSIRGLRAAC